MSPLRRHLSLGALALLTAMSYARVWGFGWVYDDAAWLPTGPFPAGVFALAAWLGGGLPWAFHAAILALHLLNGFLLSSLIRPWLSDAARLFAVACFWLHPLQVESVAYVTGGLEVLLTCYVLLAWTASRAGGLWWIAAVGCLYLAASLKYSALPLLVIVPSAWALERRVSRRVWIGCAACLLPLALVVARSALLGYAHVGSWAARLANLRVLSLALWRYLAYVAVPVGFSIEHAWPTSVVLGSVALLALLAVGVFAAITRTQVLWWGWCWIVALIAPRALTWPTAPPLTEHHTMLPFLAVWIGLGFTADRWFLVSSRSLTHA